MAEYKVVDAEKLDADLSTVADAIREKGGTSESFEFPQGFVDAVGAIESGEDIPENAVFKISEYAENGYPKKIKYQIPEGLDDTTIPNYTFGKNGSQAVPILNYIEEVEIPESVVNVGIAAFSACHRLKKISNYDNLINISDLAFFIGQGFEFKYMPPRVETIGNQAFNSAFLVYAPMVIPETVKSIGARAFYNTGITDIIFRGTPESLDASAFSGGVKNAIFCPWAEGEVANAPWGATNVTIYYNTTYDENGNPIVTEE